MSRRIVGLWLVGCGLAACSPFASTTKSWIEVESGDSTSIAHAPLHVGLAWNPQYSALYREAGTHRAEVPLTNRARLELIALDAPGHFPEHHIVQASRFNPWKLGDVAGMTGGIASMVRGSGSDTEALIAGGFFVTFGNFVAVWMNPKRVFQSEYRFEALTAMPRATDELPKMELQQFDFNLAAGSHSWSYFETVKDFERGRWVGRNASREDVTLEDTNLDEELAEGFTQQGFQAPPSYSLLRDEGTWSLHGELVGLNEDRLARAVRYEATTRWWVEHPFGLEVDTVELSTPSTWHVYETGDLGFNRAALLDAVSRAAFLAAEDQRILRDARSLGQADSLWTAQWEPLSLEPAQTAPGKVAATVYSMVTIEDEQGHGSGCIIDASGWILTNHHVASDTAKTYTVTLHDGTKLDGRLVRFHPVWDLALVKVEATGLQPFAMDVEAFPELGEDVFAIGTPYDVGLGATLTRGIVSGKRRDGAKTLIQTDVSISPGNSGGALARPNGVLVGIVTEKIMDQGVEGLGFAMPLTQLEHLLGLRFARK